MDLQRLGAYFGEKAAELSGIVTHPSHRKNLGFAMVQKYTEQINPERLIAYTRNPALLRLLGKTCKKLDLLRQDNPDEIALMIPHATVGEDGILYHIDRYAPKGLYGDQDPADSSYNGEILKDRCKLLANKNTALAISINPRIGEMA